MMTDQVTWIAVCPFARLEPERGMAALVEGCLDDPAISVPVHPVRIRTGQIEVGWSG
jgi:hypothetical protein